MTQTPTESPTGLCFKLLNMLNFGQMKPCKTNQHPRGGGRRRQAGKKKSSATSTAKIHQKLLRTIAKIPHGKVSTYGAVAAAAGYPGLARQTARALDSSHNIPWHRVLGAGGAIKLQGEHAFEQRFRLQSEGIGFRGKKVDMKQHEHRWKNA